ncbi:GerAB/ArcD/ProY family transporter [Tumebacillus permanentifrigoris]|uniref:Spore germination protein n=1 Tax=Tumebacillus permanentifrigoris TaxID=378543 RepID=A0A316D3N8_9BACL|nr:GerAB/ArcD/ProY family transporter [Tumebacillus permanentifrigoris]PWK05399.1 spore germination protein [Tumebacillus permanentifrigoris]
MKENRFLFYTILINMVSNIIVFVPHILFNGLFDGALMSILISVVIGMTLLVLGTQSLAQFPGESLPEVMERYLPRWFRVIFLSYISSFWYVAGVIVLLAFSTIMTRYLSPETGQFTILFFLSLTVLLVVPLKSSRLLNGLEILFVINIPLIAIILLKSVLEKNTDWEDVYDVCTHLVHLPTLTMIAAASYIFTGYTNLVIFNKETAIKLKKRHYLILGGLGFATLMTSFFIPIGRLGEFSVNRYTFPWIPTSDSISMQYFVIERMMIPFLLVYLMVALVQAVMHWHIGYHLILSLFRQQRKWQNYAVLAAFTLGVGVLQKILDNEYILFEFATYWLIARLFSEIGLVALLIYLAKRRRRHEQQI